jgi:hypothetical protein
MFPSLKGWMERRLPMPSTPLVIIPAHNEEARIVGVIESIFRHLPGAEVLIVDDGSKDRTCEAALGTRASVVSHPFNLGYGAALQTGYRYALAKGYGSLVQMDGDGQHDPAFIPHLLAAIEGGDADVAIGSRFLPVGGMVSDYAPYQATLMRRLGMKFFGTLASLIIGQKVTDPTSGYQAMNSRVLEWVSGDRFPFDYPDADVIIMLHRAGFRIREVPVRMFERRDKKSMHSGWKPLYYVFKMFLSIFVTLLRK